MANYLREVVERIGGVRDNYRNHVIAHFKSGNATKEEWEELAESVLYCADEYESCPCIDKAVGLEIHDLTVDTRREVKREGG